MWKMFADAGCHPGLDNPLAIECSPMAAMTDRRLTPFQRLLYKPPTDDDPTAFLAVRTTGTEDGLAVFDLPPRLMASTEGHRLDGIALVEETELRRLYPADRLVTWV